MRAFVILIKFKKRVPLSVSTTHLCNDYFIAGLLDGNNRLTGGLNGDTMGISLENERLKNEVYELRRLLSMQDNITATESSRDDVILQLHEDLDGPERVEALEKEIIHAKGALDGKRLCNLIGLKFFYTHFLSSLMP